MGGSTSEFRRASHRRTGMRPKVRNAAWWALICAMVLAGMLAVPRFGHATVPGVDQTTLAWDTGNRAYYGEYNTPIFTTTDTAGKVSLAYCVDPTTTVPPAGSYATIPVEEFNPYWAVQIRAAMWFSYGGPGFDPAMWPQSWNDGSAMDPAKYYAASHLILSYATTQNMGYVYYNAGADFIGYAAGTFLGYDLGGNAVNPNSTMLQMFARANEVPDTYTCYYLDCGQWDYAQYVIAQDYYEPPAPATGALEICKLSTLPGITENNPLYRLEGAVFGIYTDEACANLRAELTVGADGVGRVEGLEPGRYWICETTAPQGFVLDKTVHVANVPSGETASVEVPNTPQVAQPELAVQKTDAQTGGEAQGDASLADARFTVNYYDGHHTLETLPSQPVRSWQLKSDAQGNVRLDKAHLLGGDPLYQNADGQAVLPLGTVTIQETSAPPGYREPDQTLHVIDIVSDDPTSMVQTYLAPVVPNSVLRGGLTIQKSDRETGSTQSQGNAGFGGAEFAVVSLNENPVVVNGTTYRRGDTVLRLATDERGFTSSAPDALPRGLYLVQESKAPEGYLIPETTWEVYIAGADMVSVGDRRVEGPRSAAAEVAPQPAAQLTQSARRDKSPSPLRLISNLLAPRAAHAGEAMQPCSLAHDSYIPEQVIRGGVRIYKADAETPDGTAQGDATLAGTEFSITSLNEGPVLVDGVLYNIGEVVKRIYTDADGVAQTGEHDLPFGTYSIEETGAPWGYLSSPPVISIEQNGVIVELGEKFENEVKRGGIEIHKVDAETATGKSQGAATLAGTTFAIVNASEQAVVVGDLSYEPGETIMTVQTDETGVARTGTRDLPFGTYTITEVAPPEGYLAGNGASQSVSVTQDGQMAVLPSPFANAVVRGGIAVQKVDADSLTGEPQGSASLAGAQFSVANANDRPVLVQGATYQPGETVLVLTTDESGYAASATDALPYGTYAVREVQAPEGYLANEEEQTVTISEHGATVDVPSPFADRVVRGGFGLRKLDAETQQAVPQGSASLAGARFEVVNDSPRRVVINDVVFEPGAVVATLETNEDGWAQTGNHDLPYGTYSVREVLAPAGYRIGDGSADGMPCLSVVIDKDWAWHSYESEIRDQVVRGGISIAKTDAELGAQSQGSASLAGAQFQISNASQHAVVVNGSPYQPGEVVATLTTDESGAAATGTRDLPFGTYEIRESAAPEGYLPDASPQLVSIVEEGIVVPAAQPFVNSVARGTLELRKVDAEIGMAGPQGSASYQGAVFEVVNANPHPVTVSGITYAPEETVATMATDAGGYASTTALPYGTYRIREVQAPTGYLANTGAWEARIDCDGQIVTVGERLDTVVPLDTSTPEQDADPSPLDAIVAFLSPATAHATEARQNQPEERTVPEQVIRGGVSVQKVDRETGEARPQGGATLAGTEFSIVSLNPNPVVVGGAVYQKGETVLTITANDGGVASTEPHALPFGIYALHETQPPLGYLPEDEGASVTFSITHDGETLSLDKPFSNEPIRGGICIQKLDRDTGEGHPLADGSLAQAEFSIVNANPHPVIVAGTSYGPGETVLTIATDETGYAATGMRDLPFGIYRVAEANPPEGYTPSPDPVEQEVALTQDGVVVSCETPFRNRIARGDVMGVKVEDGTGSPMSGVAFLVTSLTTGERHVVVADAQGIFSTANSFAVHSHNTNANDAALKDGKDNIDESCLSPENGVWFSGSSKLAMEPNDAFGALPFDRYRFDELATSASYGHDLVSFEVAVREDGTTVDLGQITDQVIELKTRASIAQTGLNEGPCVGDARIIDEVSYQGLIPGETYKLVTQLVNRETGETVPLSSSEGESDVSVRSFQAESDHGTVVVEVDLDASQLAGVRVVVLERLLHREQELASHADRADDAQTVTFVSLATKAVGAVSQTHEEQARDTTGVIDTVSFSGLTPGVEYTLEGILMDRRTGEELVLGRGQTAVATTKFVPQAASGTVEVSYEFPATDLAGTTVVAFEQLLRGDTVIARHADLADPEQSVTLVSMRTTATDRLTGTHTGKPSEQGGVVDRVSYQGLAPGETYTVEGVLVGRENGKPLADSSGRIIKASVDFVPAEPSGEVLVEFPADTSSFQGESAVVLENLLHGNAIIASHADLDDRDQTVTWPIPHIPVTGDRDPLVTSHRLATVGGATIATGVAAALLFARREAARSRQAELEERTRRH